MFFLEDLKINNNSVFIFGLSSEYSIHLIKLFSKNEINTYVWDYDIELVIKYQNKDEYKSKYINFINPKELKDNKCEYFIITKYIPEENEFFDFFSSASIKNKVCTDSDIIQKLYPNNSFIGIIGNYGESIIKNIINFLSKEFKLNIYSEINDNFELNLPIFMSFRKVEYIKEINFTNIILYECKDDYFSDKKNMEKFNKIILNKEEMKLMINIDNQELKDLYEKILEDENFVGKIIPFSTSKILEDGISYVNGTICDYNDNNNINYDMIENEFIDNDFTKLSILISFLYFKINNFDCKSIIKSFSHYMGEKNFFEHLKNIENIRIINNIGADSDYLINLPFKNCENIYSLLFVNGLNFDKKFFENNSKVVFYIDKNNLLNSSYENVFSDEKEAFEKIYSLAVLEEKENIVNILISTISANKNKSFGTEINNIKNVIDRIFV